MRLSVSGLLRPRRPAGHTKFSALETGKRENTANEGSAGAVDAPLEGPLQCWERALARLPWRTRFRARVERVAVQRARASLAFALVQAGESVRGLQASVSAADEVVREHYGASQLKEAMAALRRKKVLQADLVALQDLRSKLEQQRLLLDALERNRAAAKSLQEVGVALSSVGMRTLPSVDPATDAALDIEDHASDLADCLADFSARAGGESDELLMEELLSTYSASSSRSGRSSVACLGGPSECPQLPVAPVAPVMGVAARPARTARASVQETAESGAEAAEAAAEAAGGMMIL